MITSLNVAKKIPLLSYRRHPFQSTLLKICHPQSCQAPSHLRIERQIELVRSVLHIRSGRSSRHAEHDIVVSFSINLQVTGSGNADAWYNVVRVRAPRYWLAASGSNAFVTLMTRALAMPIVSAARVARTQADSLVGPKRACLHGRCRACLRKSTMESRPLSLSSPRANRAKGIAN